jgi:hypothetical protein
MAKQPSYRVRRAMSKWVGRANVLGRTDTAKARPNPAKKVSLKNFTGTITKNPNGTVSIRGRKK